MFCLTLIFLILYIMLKIENVHKSYKKAHVLKGVTFSVKPNEIKGMIGVNGAGKSTLIEIVCGVKKLDSGKILINNIDIADKKRQKDLQKIIGYMPQTFTLFNDLTVEENLGYLCSIYGLDANKRIDEILELCNLTQKRKVLAHHLSGGYRQLLSCAGALIHNPKLLILDEPTSAMDPLFRRGFWKIINKCKEQGTTVLLITHHMEELRECDSFVCLENGVVSVDKTVQEVGKTVLDIERILAHVKEEK